MNITLTNMMNEEPLLGAEDFKGLRPRERLFECLIEVDIAPLSLACNFITREQLAACGLGGDSIDEQRARLEKMLSLKRQGKPTEKLEPIGIRVTSDGVLLIERDEDRRSEDRRLLLALQESGCKRVLIKVSKKDLERVEGIYKFCAQCVAFKEGRQDGDSSHWSVICSPPVSESDKIRTAAGIIFDESRKMEQKPPSRDDASGFSEDVGLLGSGAGNRDGEPER